MRFGRMSLAFATAIGGAAALSRGRRCDGVAWSGIGPADVRHFGDGYGAGRQALHVGQVVRRQRRQRRWSRQWGAPSGAGGAGSRLQGHIPRRAGYRSIRMSSAAAARPVPVRPTGEVAGPEASASPTVVPVATGTSAPASAVPASRAMTAEAAVAAVPALFARAASCVGGNGKEIVVAGGGGGGGETVCAGTNGGSGGNGGTAVSNGSAGGNGGNAGINSSGSAGGAGGVTQHPQRRWRRWRWPGQQPQLR